MLYFTFSLSCGKNLNQNSNSMVDEIKNIVVQERERQGLSKLDKCWDPYKRPLNRPKFSETGTVSVLAGQLFGGRPFGRPAWRPNF
ncbi:hypothetical protein BpHYR1_008109 [Brachionus plicatilis]|uniref:Uncharacterized protein n=1 Tax=Brachionus plicatilis TaxID=10195 RepID=A0A3M7QYM3_BRAPC|nr:hypothetical protein BpHYR1_008109 [Brachionus plicatilis]